MENDHAKVLKQIQERVIQKALLIVLLMREGHPPPGPPAQAPLQKG